MNPMKVGIIGCGQICPNYLSYAHKLPSIEVAACADLAPERAETMVRDHGAGRACSVDELLGDDDIEAVMNLTHAAAHADVSLQIIEAGKHLYTEKPLAFDRTDGQRILAAARARGVRISAAPDTFLGAAHQTARKLIDDGVIGPPIAAVTYMRAFPGESVDDLDAFLSPQSSMFDWGPYYVNLMIQLLGPIRRVHGAVTKQYHDKNPGMLTQVTCTLEMVSNVMVMLVSSRTPRFDPPQDSIVFGTDGMLCVPSPNGFDGLVQLRSKEEAPWQDVPHTHTTGYGRSVGMAEMAAAIRRDRPHRATGQIALAVLDALQGFGDSARTGKSHEMIAEHDQPAPIPPGLSYGQFDIE